jgi:hypothetical protein
MRRNKLGLSTSSFTGKALTLKPKLKEFATRSKGNDMTFQK